MKDTIKSPSIDTGIDITKMHGHMDIYLTDVKTGKVEEVHEDNMMTNALQEYFRNCGFMNYPNVNRSNMVVELLGGIMAFNDEISENASQIRVPAGLKMIANGSVGTVNNGAVLELGSYSTTESGWQNDGSYVQTYDYTTAQANGTIACVCLTGQNYGYVGEGNSISKVSHATKKLFRNIEGTTTAYTIPSGYNFGYNHTDSSCYVFTVESRVDEQTEETVKYGVLRKIRLPISKLNIKGTLTDPIILSETEITLDSDFQDWTFFRWQPLGNNLLIWNVSGMDSMEYNQWGVNFTQFLWTVSTSGTITKQTVVNMTDDPNMLGITNAIFDGQYCVFPKTSRLTASVSQTKMDTRTLYVWNRNSNSVSVIENEFGNEYTLSNSYDNYNLLVCHHCSGDGRIYNQTGTGSNYIIDCVNEETYITNGLLFNSDKRFSAFGDILFDRTNNLYRDQGYIASINNLDNPVVKTSEKTMKIIYRITFDEQ